MKALKKLRSLPIFKSRDSSNSSSNSFRWVQPGLSHVTGETTPPLNDTDTMFSRIASQAEKLGDSPMLYFHETNNRYSWRDFHLEVRRVAECLISIGINPGDRVGVWMGNYYEWLTYSCGIMAMGGIAVNVNPAYQKADLLHCLNLVGMKGIIIVPEFKTTKYAEMLYSLFPQLENTRPGNLKSEDAPSLETIICVSDTAMNGMYQHSNLEPIASAKSLFSSLVKSVQPKDPCNIQFTSGTTGFPKGATLTHHNIINNGYYVGCRLRLTRNDNICIPVPFYHCFGQVLGFMAGLGHGSPMTIPAPVFDPEATLTAVSLEECTALYGVPTMFLRMLDHEVFPSCDFSRLRTGIMAGSLCPPTIMERVIENMNLTELTICYGMTETSPVSFQSSTDTPFQQKCASVGFIHPHVECKVVNEDGEVVPVGHEGELYTKGYVVMNGYWGQPEKTKECIDDEGYMKTGDVATIDQDGYLTITGRIKDMIIRGGENIFPIEIEDFLLKNLEGVYDVAVVGVPSADFGEEVCCFLIPKDRSMMDQSYWKDKVRQSCDGQLARYKIPKIVFVIDNFPVTVTGKVQKYLLRKQAEELLARE